MIFDILDEKYLQDAVKLAQAQYNMEQKHIEALYEKDYKEVLTEALSETFEGKYGVVAVEKGKVLGYLSFWRPINGFFGNVKGAFSPLFANACDIDNKDRVLSLLFQHASEEMVKEEILNYAICLYGHDIEAMKTLTINGFGMRCSDLIRSVDKPLNIEINKDYSYEEIHYSKAGCLLSLKNGLEKHMCQSPTYFPKKELSEEGFAQLCNENKSRFFIAKDKSEVIGYLEITKEGETFITLDSDYMHLCGAYLKDEYRGKNILQSLLGFVLETLNKENVKRLGVDCETINPNAFRFWRKYFDNYTYSFVRRIDERILK